MAKQGKGNILPLGEIYTELLNRCRDQKVWILLTEGREFVGISKGHDEHFNIILENCKE